MAARATVPAQPPIEEVDPATIVWGRSALTPILRSAIARLEADPRIAVVVTAPERATPHTSSTISAALARLAGERGLYSVSTQPDGRFAIALAEVTK